MYVYCVYPAMSESPKQMPNCLKRAETIVVLIVFNSVLCHVCTYSGTVSYRPLHELGTRKALLGS